MGNSLGHEYGFQWAIPPHRWRSLTRDGTPPVFVPVRDRGTRGRKFGAQTIENVGDARRPVGEVGPGPEVGRGRQKNEGPERHEHPDSRHSGRLPLTSETGGANVTIFCRVRRTGPTTLPGSSSSPEGTIPFRTPLPRRPQQVFDMDGPSPHPCRETDLPPSHLHPGHPGPVPDPTQDLGNPRRPHGTGSDPPPETLPSPPPIPSPTPQPPTRNTGSNLGLTYLPGVPSPLPPVALVPTHTCTHIRTHSHIHTHGHP